MAHEHNNFLNGFAVCSECWDRIQAVEVRTLRWEHCAKEKKHFARPMESHGLYVVKTKPDIETLEAVAKKYKEAVIAAKYRADDLKRELKEGIVLARLVIASDDALIALADAVDKLLLSEADAKNFLNSQFTGSPDSPPDDQAKS